MVLFCILFLVSSWVLVFFGFSVCFCLWGVYFVPSFFHHFSLFFPFLFFNNLDVCIIDVSTSSWSACQVAEAGCTLDINMLLFIGRKRATVTTRHRAENMVIKVGFVGIRLQKEWWRWLLACQVFYYVRTIFWIINSFVWAIFTGIGHWRPCPWIRSWAMSFSPFQIFGRSKPCSTSIFHL